MKPRTIAIGTEQKTLEQKPEIVKDKKDVA